MSHITAAKLSITLKDRDILKSALNLMQKEGYAVKTGENETFVIDMRSMGITHAYTNMGRGDQYSQIVITKDQKTGDYTCNGDPWSIYDGYQKTIKTLEKCYTSAGVMQALKAQGFMAQLKTLESPGTKSIGKTLISGSKW